MVPGSVDQLLPEIKDRVATLNKIVKAPLMLAQYPVWRLGRELRKSNQRVLMVPSSVDQLMHQNKDQEVFLNNTYSAESPADSSLSLGA